MLFKHNFFDVVLGDVFALEYLAPGLFLAFEDLLSDFHGFFITLDFRVPDALFVSDAVDHDLDVKFRGVVLAIHNFFPVQTA